MCVCSVCIVIVIPLWHPFRFFIFCFYVVNLLYSFISFVLFSSRLRRHHLRSNRYKMYASVDFISRYFTFLPIFTIEKFKVHKKKNHWHFARVSRPSHRFNFLHFAFVDRGNAYFRSSACRKMCEQTISIWFIIHWDCQTIHSRVKQNEKKKWIKKRKRRQMSEHKMISEHKRKRRETFENQRRRRIKK